MTDAARRGRFRGIQRVWVVEYVTDGEPDTWGVDGLRELGFHEVAAEPGHRSVIALYER